jgi:hypothetical protein
MVNGTEDTIKNVGQTTELLDTFKTDATSEYGGSKFLKNKDNHLPHTTLS